MAPVSLLRLTAEQARDAITSLDGVKIEGVHPVDELMAIEALLSLAAAPRLAPAETESPQDAAKGVKPRKAPPPAAGEPTVSAGTGARPSLIVKLSIPSWKTSSPAPSPRKTRSKGKTTKPSPDEGLPSPGPADPPKATIAPSTGVRKTVEWTGQPSGRGHSILPPPADLVNSTLNSSAWHCGVPECATGLSWFDREGPNGVGRKTVSQYFGRNKKETATIPSDVWQFMCRKHYQRLSYKASHTADSKIGETVNLVLDQLGRLECWRPNARFRVQLSRVMHERMAFWKECGDVYAITAKKRLEDFHVKYPVAKTNAQGVEKEDVSAEAKFPWAMADHFVSAFEGNGKTYAEVRSMLAWIVTRPTQGDGALTVVPPFEILINKQAANEQGVTDPSTNYDLWMATKPAKTTKPAIKKQPTKKQPTKKQPTKKNDSNKNDSKTPVKKGAKREYEEDDDDDEQPEYPKMRVKFDATKSPKSPVKTGAKRDFEEDDDDDEPEMPKKKRVKVDQSPVKRGTKRRFEDDKDEDDEPEVPKKRGKFQMPTLRYFL